LESFSDAKLIEQCLAGIQQHCRALFERYKGYVAGVIWKSVMDEEVLQDLTQDVFLRAFKGLPGFKGKSSFKTWLTRITINVIRDYRKKQPPPGSSMVSLDDLDNNERLDSLRSSWNPAHEVLQKELNDRIRAAIDKLPPEHKDTILLWSNGYSYSEIAESTGVSSQTVGSRIYYARDKLRKLLAPYLKGKDK